MSIIYTDFLQQILTSDVDLLVDDIRAMLLTPYYEPYKEHTFADIKPFEITSKNYTEGGNSLYITLQSDTQVKSAKVRWVDLTAKVQYVFVYKNGDHPLPILCQDLSLRDLQNNNFAINWEDFLLELSQGEDSARIESTSVLGSMILGKAVLGTDFPKEN